MDTITVSVFKATCLGVLKRLAKTGRPLLITRLGKPLAMVTVPPPPKPTKKSSYGCMKGTMEIHGDIMEPFDPQMWEALRK